MLLKYACLLRGRPPSASVYKGRCGIDQSETCVLEIDDVAVSRFLLTLRDHQTLHYSSSRSTLRLRFCLHY